MKLKKILRIVYYGIYSFLYLNNYGQTTVMTTVQIVQQNLEAYNQRNLEAFLSSFSADIAIYNFGESTPSTLGLEAVRKRYQDLFLQSPNLHSTILKRMVFDNKIIDHESIIGRLGAKESLEIIMIYEVKEQKIFKMTVIRK